MISLRTFYSDISAQIPPNKREEPYFVNSQNLFSECAPAELAKRVEHLHEILCGMDGRNPLVPSINNPDLMVPVTHYLEEKRI